jgi:A/G-specific adenine glycosylase
LPRAIVDGNVQRVLSRFLAIRGDTKTPKSVGSKLIWQQSAMLVEHAGDEPGTFNQALMELGATLCTPVKPSCGSCPVREACRAQRQYGQLKKASPFFKKRKAAVIESDVEDLPDICTICPTEAFALPVKKDFIESHYPLKIAKKQQRLEHALVVIVREGDTVYVERKQTGLLAGLYDFPTHILEDEPPDTFDKGLHMIGQTIHLFTHIRRQSTILTSKSLDILDTLPGTRTACADGIWIKQDALAEQGVSELCLKSWRIVTGEKKAMKKTFKDVA